MHRMAFADIADSGNLIIALFWEETKERLNECFFEQIVYFIEFQQNNKILESQAQKYICKKVQVLVEQDYWFELTLVCKC